MKQHPPRLAQRLFSWYCRNHLHDSILGDLDEQFYQNLSKYGPRRAKWNYWLEVFRFVNRFTLKRERNSNYYHPYSRGMLKNTIISSLRFFRKHLGFTSINIFGLTLGLSSFLLIILFVQHEQSFDDFLPNTEQAFRVNFAYQDNAGNTTTLVNSPPALAPGIRGKFPEVDKISRLRYTMNCILAREEVQYYESKGYYADSLFLEVLPFEMQMGDPSTALDQPNSIVITESLARKYFNDPAPLGSTLQFNGTEPLKVTGILADLPSNSHLDFDFLISFSNYIVPEGYASDLSSWSWLGFLTYVSLRPETDPQRFEANLAQHFRDLNPEAENHLLPIVQGVSDIYLGSAGMSDDLASPIRVGNRLNVKALFLVAMLILLIAGFNFSNLSQALSVNRTRTIGMLKVLGAQKRSIIVQLLTESLLLTFACLVLASGLVLLAFPYVSQYMQWQFNLNWSAMLGVLPMLLSAGILVGVLAGLYPAFRLAQRDIMTALKGTSSAWNRNPFQFKHLLLTMQFAMSIGLICATFIMTRQINYLRNTSTGYQAESVVLVKMLPEDMSRFFELYKEQLVTEPSVRAVSRSERMVGEPWPFSVIRRVGEDPDLSKRIFFNQVDYNYFATLAIPMHSGRSFSLDHLNDPTQSIILNKTAVEYLGLEDPIGQQVHFFELDGPRTVVGIVEDFNYTSLHQEIGPAAVILPFIDLEYMYIRFDQGQLADQVVMLENTWEEVAGGVPLQWSFLDEGLANLYQTEQRLSGMIQFFSLLAIVLACLGLYGMVSFTLNQRIKEVGLRKVLGATYSSLYLLFVRTYFMQSLVAMVVIIPIIHYSLTTWLEDFDYRVSIGWWIYPVATGLLVTLILITVSMQIVKTTKVNPTELLRYE